jgi:sirohydrochlorin cobaltochelatase
MDTRTDLTLATLEQRLEALLPQEYQDNDDAIEPVPMGSAPLKYDVDGKVAWHEIWQSFCDLAMAGGPPHKGALLRPGSAAEIAAQPTSYRAVVDEICRGVTMATGSPAQASDDPGWVDVGCDSDGMAAWLLRAITMENVSVRVEDSVLALPAGPGYRLEMEIKNVVTVIAKTCHYWSGHMWRFEQRAIAELFADMARVSPLIVPALVEADALAPPDAWLAVHERLRAAVDLPVAPYCYADWIGVECASVRTAIWMMRMMIASNVLARREETRLYVPVNRDTDPGGAIVTATIARITRLAAERVATI